MPFNLFGGGTVQISDVSYRAVALSADVTLVWPNLSQTSTDVVARIMDVTPTTTGLDITMPDAREASTGVDILFYNVGSDTYTILSNTGTTLGTVAAGVMKLLYLTDNSTQAGTWRITTFGTGTSAPDAAALAGYGIKAISSTLNQMYDMTQTSSNVTITSADRASIKVWTAGTLTCTLPTAASVGDDFFFVVKNGGTGTITVTCTGADTIDGSTTFSLAPDEGAIIYSGGATATWYTVGKGRAVAFAFTQLVKSVAGSSNVTLSSSECANKVMEFTGVLTGNINVIVTNTVSVYYVFNNTTGAFTLTVKTAAGTGVTVSQSTRDILTCDATNVYRSITNTATSTSFDPGTEGSPSITFTGDTDTGFYSPGANVVAATAGGTEAMRWNTAGSAINSISVFPSATGAEVYMKPLGGDASVSFGIRALGTTGTVILQDGNGNEVLMTGVATASAINEVTVTNAAAGNPPKIASTGGDTNISLLVTAKGAGQVLFEDDEFIVRDNADATKKAAFQASGITTATTRTFTFPDASDTFAVLAASQTITNKTVQHVNTGLQVLDTDSSHYLVIVPGSNITANRNLTLVTGDAARTITLAGALTIAADFITSGANSLTLTTTGSTNVTLPTSGTLIGNITDLAAETSPATDDELAIYDLSQGANNKMTFANFLKVVNSLTEDASPDASADFLLEYDTSASAAKKVKISNLPTSSNDYDLLSIKAASGQAEITFESGDGLNTTTYGTFVFVFNGILPSGADALWVALGYGVGPTYDTGSTYDVAAISNVTLAAVTGVEGRFVGSVSNTASNGGFNGNARLFNFASSSQKRFLHTQGALTVAGTGTVFSSTVTWTDVTHAGTAAKFYWQSGATFVAGGSIAMYGMRQV